jgi:hypothetical protein
MRFAPSQSLPKEFPMTPLFSRIAAFAVLSTVFISAAQAQTEVQVENRVIGGPLADVNVVQMTVAPLSEQSRACGMDSNLILESFKAPLSEKGIVVQQAAHVWIQLKATTLRYDADICITHVEALAVQNTRYYDRVTATERSGRVLIWSDGGLFLTGVSNHGVTTNIGWSDLARSFLRKWQMDQ